MQGFTLDSLVKLKDAKAFDNRTSVMHFLARLMARQHPDTLDLFSKGELKARIPEAAGVSSASVNRCPTRSYLVFKRRASQIGITNTVKTILFVPV